jgi:hypothetical protein
MHSESLLRLWQDKCAHEWKGVSKAKVIATLYRDLSRYANAYVEMLPVRLLAEEIITLPCPARFKRQTDRKQRSSKRD